MLEMYSMKNIWGLSMFPVEKLGNFGEHWKTTFISPFVRNKMKDEALHNMSSMKILCKTT